MRWLGWWCTALALAACAHHDARRLVMPASVEPARASLEEQLLQAQQVVATFAGTHGWGALVERPAYDAVEVFDDQRLLWQRIVSLSHLPEQTPLPTPGLAAVIEHRVLLVLSPRAYAQVAPAYAGRPEAWARLVAHELVHRLHVAAVGGDDDQMGPQWFFEGLAVVGAGQGLDEGLVYRSAEEALAGAHETTAPHSYRRFAAAVRYFSGRTPLPELVRRASAPDFEAWLLGGAPR